MVETVELLLDAWVLGSRELAMIKSQLTSAPPSCPEALPSIVCFLEGESQKAMQDVDQSIEEDPAAVAALDWVSGGDALHPGSQRLATQAWKGHCLATVNIDVLCKKLLEVENAVLCPTRDIVEGVEVQHETFNPSNMCAKISELCDREEVNLTFDTQRMEDIVAKGRAEHHKAGITLLQRPLIIRPVKNDARNLHSHPGVIISIL